MEEIIETTYVHQRKVHKLEIHPLPKVSEFFLKKSIILYGTSGKGKTRTIREIMYICREFFTEVYLIFPTYSQQPEAYPFAPSPLVYTEVSIEKLEAIAARREAIAAIYKNINSLKFMEAFCSRFSQFPYYTEMLNSIIALNKKYERATGKIRQRADFNERTKNELIYRLKGKIGEKKLKIYKSYIAGISSQMMSIPNLDEEAKTVIKYLKVKGDFGLIFDDCTTEMENLYHTAAGKDFIDNMFMRFRHGNGLVGYLAHDISKVAATLRKAAMISIFTEQTLAIAFFTNKSNGLSLEMQHKGEQVAKKLFEDKQHDYKMVYVKDVGFFYYEIQDPPEEFELCTEGVREYCNRIGIDMTKSTMNIGYISSTLGGI